MSCFQLIEKPSKQGDSHPAAFKPWSAHLCTEQRVGVLPMEHSRR